MTRAAGLVSEFLCVVSSEVTMFLFIALCQQNDSLQGRCAVKRWIHIERGNLGEHVDRSCNHLDYFSFRWLLMLHGAQFCGIPIVKQVSPCHDLSWVSLHFAASQ